jgi:acyl-CoA thioesterase II
VIELPGTPEEMLAFLELEHIDGDIYRGGIGFWPEDRPAIYGGQVAAQALRAAGHTIPEGRLPHSLHGYFLRRGDIEAPVIFKVDRDRDGRSFSARRVTAMQHGEVIWDMACSFAPPIEGAAEYTPEVNSQIASPEACVLNQEEWCPLVEIRTAPHPDGRETPPRTNDRVWAKVRVPVPADPMLHACLLAFVADIGAGFGDVAGPGIPLFGPSIDFSIWFHGAANMNDWVLFESSALKVGGHRGLYRSSAHSADGQLVAMVNQEMLLRPELASQY